MPSLKEILDDIDIKIEDDNNKDKDVDIDKIPEEYRPAFQGLMQKTKDFEIELSKRDILIQALREARQDTKKDDKQEEKDDDDPYAPKFREVKNDIEEIRNFLKQSKQTSYEESVVNFAKENKDMVKYVKEMDALVNRHPSLKTDIPLLYSMAKNIKEGRSNKEKLKKEELDRENNVINFRTESGGFSLDNIRQEGGAKTIAEALDKAYDSLSGQRR